MKEVILFTDGYKLDHRRQYPDNTKYVYSNWTPRSCKYYPEANEGAVVFGIQYFIKEVLSIRTLQYIQPLRPIDTLTLIPLSKTTREVLPVYIDIEAK